MKHIPLQGRIGLCSQGLVPQNDLKSRVLQSKTHWLVSEMWCVGCFDRNFLREICTVKQRYGNNVYSNRGRINEVISKCKEPTTEAKNI